MTNFVVEPQIWAEQNFGDCELGDARRTRRLVQIAEQAAARPDGSTPDQTECWGDCKAVYRLMDCDDVSHAVPYGQNTQTDRKFMEIHGLKRRQLENLGRSTLNVRAISWSEWPERCSITIDEAWAILI